MRVSQSIVRKRLIIVLLGGIIIFTIIATRLGYVQFYLGEILTEKAKNSWSRDIRFQAKRGEITDRNGIVLATNITAPTILFVPRQIVDPEETAKKIASILEVSKEKVFQTITKKASSVYLRPEGIKITSEKAKEIQALHLKGVYVAEDSKRYYPFGDYLSHVLGFAGSDNQGLSGLELTYDNELKGEAGYVQFYSDAKGKRMPNIADDYTPPKNGATVQLTINAKVQTILERELDNADATYSPESAIAIAMNPKTGEILGMASRPTFNPSDYQEVPAEIYNRNLPVWSTYEPGSTFKIITLAGALNEGLVDLDKDKFHDDGSTEIDGAILHCWKRGGHGSQTFLEVVENSCNPGFIELGERLGTAKLFDYIDRFGFGTKTGIDLPGEGNGILFNPKKIGPVETATTAFGQGVSVTPIQQVAAVAAAINGGTLYQPFITKQVIDESTGEIIEEKKPIVIKENVISKETSSEVRRALENVAANGSAKAAYIDGYRVGGKTGTAQKVQNGRYLEDNYIVSTIAFAPADDPEIVVYVAIDYPKGVTQYGGVVAAPIVGNILRDALPAIGIKKREGGLDKEIVWPESPMISIPNVVGKSATKINSELANLNVLLVGSGNKVIRQSPSAGTKVEIGADIRIYLGDK